MDRGRVDHLQYVLSPNMLSVCTRKHYFVLVVGKPRAIFRDRARGEGRANSAKQDLFRVLPT